MTSTFCLAAVIGLTLLAARPAEALTVTLLEDNRFVYDYGLCGVAIALRRALA